MAIGFVGQLGGAGGSAGAASAIDYGVPVQDLTELRAVPPALRGDKQQRLVEDENAEYRFDATGVGADDGDLIIVPDTGTGRWFKITPSGGIPSAHATSHENVGSDEISVAGLSGLLADDQNPVAHGSEHNPDGTDAVATAAPSSVGTANVEGAATSLARSDHVHNHGAQISGTLHAPAIAAGASGFLTGTDKSKLNGVEPSADVTDAANVAAAGAVMDSDISEAEGFLRKTGVGTYEALKTNLAAVTDPGTGDDNTAGYAVGSRWINVTLDSEFIAVDVSTGAAVWKKTTSIFIKTTDDLKTLVAAASAGDCFRLEEGTHTYEAPLTIPADRVSLEGCAGTTLATDGVGIDSAILLAAGVDDVTLRNFKIQVANGDVDGVRSAGVSNNVRLLDLQIEKLGATLGDGIQIGAASESWRMANCNIVGAFVNGIRFKAAAGTTKYHVIDKNLIQNLTGGTSGVVFEATLTIESIVITNNVIEGFDSGLLVASGNTWVNGTVQANIFLDQATVAIDTVTGTFDISTVIGNIIGGAGVVGIRTGNGDKNIWSGNKINGTVLPIHINGSAGDSLFSNNHLTATGGTVELVLIDGAFASRNEFVGNRLIGSGAQVGIKVADGDDWLILGNHITGLGVTVGRSIWFTGGPTRGAIAENFIDGNQECIYVENAGVVIRDNTLQTGTKGIVVDLLAIAGAEGPIIEGNTIRSMSSNGIEIIGNVATNIDGFTCSRNKVFLAGGESVKISDADDGDVNGNRLKDGSNDGINLVDVQESVFNSNRVSGHLVAAKVGIREDATSDQNLYSSNHLRGNTAASSFSGTNRTELGTKV